MNEAEIRASIASINDDIKRLKEALSLYPPLPHCNPEQRVDRLKYEERLDKEKERLDKEKEDLRENHRRLDRLQPQQDDAMDIDSSSAVRIPFEPATIPPPLLKRLSDPEFIEELRSKHGYLPRLHGLGGSIIKESYFGEGNTVQFEGIKFKDTHFVYSDRKETLEKILLQLDEVNAILVRSPPMAGKTSISQLLEKHLVETYDTRLFRVFRVSMLWMNAAGEGWDFEAQFKRLFCTSWSQFVLECQIIETYLICDEIQMLYCPTTNSAPDHGGKSFWDQFKLACQGGNLKIIAFATYGYRAASHLTPTTTINISPFKLQSKSILSLQDILFSEFEFNDFVRNYCKHLSLVNDGDITTLQVFLQSLTNRHPGITSFCLSQILQRFGPTIKRCGTLNLGNVFEYIHSFNFLNSLLTYMRAYTPTNLLSEDERILCDKVLVSPDGKGLRLDDDRSNSSTHTRLLSINTLVENDGFLDFSAPIIRSLYIIDRFGSIRTATTPPTSFKDFLIRTISAMNPSTLRNSIGCGKDGRLYERTYQLEFYRAASQVLPSNICISPDVGAVYSIRGFVDFHIEYKGGWVVELLRDADKRIAHMNRFTRNGRYYPIVLEVSEWAVVDIQGPQCSVSHPDVVDNLVVVKIDDQYTTASVRFGDEDLGIVQFVRQ